MKKTGILLIIWAFLSLSRLAAAAEHKAIVVFDGFWLGCVNGDKWAYPELIGDNPEEWEQTVFPKGEELYDIYLSTGLAFEKAKGSPLRLFLEPDAEEGELEEEEDWIGDYIDITGADDAQNEILAEKAFLAVSHDGFPVALRKTVALPLKNPEYEKIVGDYLKENGIDADTIQITQLYRVDLEGDGTEEILIYAQNILDPVDYAEWWAPDVPMDTFTEELPTEAKKGDYSLTLLRKTVNGAPQNIPLTFFKAEKDSDSEEWITPSIDKICQFVDLDGDGVLEIILGFAYYEGYGYNVYKTGPDGKVEMVLGGGNEI